MKQEINCVMATAAAPEEKRERRTKLVRVKQVFIDCLLKQREERPRRAFPSLSLESVDRLYRDWPEEGERVRSLWAQAAAIIKGREDKDDEILRQYHTKGYAMEEVEIRGDDNDDEDDDGSSGDEEVEDATAGAVAGSVGVCKV